MTGNAVDSFADVRTMVRDFARSELAPHARDWDARAHFPREVFRALGELGLLGMLIPEEYGGAGLDVPAVRHRAGGAGRRRRRRRRSRVAAHNSLCTNHLYLFGSESAEARAGCPSWRAASGSAPGA